MITSKKLTANNRYDKTKSALAKRAREIAQRLEKQYPGSAAELCALQFTNPFELLVATILSAQCTDKRVNMVTPILFERYDTPEKLAHADINDVEEIIKSTGFFRSKASNIIKMSGMLTENFSSKVPNSMEELVSLAGVGRKTANVVLSVAFCLPGLPVDTHVKRLSNRLGLSGAKSPEVIESDLNELIEPSERGALSLRLILHGRNVCTAANPKCEKCILADLCPSSKMPAVRI